MTLMHKRKWENEGLLIPCNQILTFLLLNSVSHAVVGAQYMRNRDEQRYSTNTWFIELNIEIKKKEREAKWV
jgi:hypothetical protein